MNSNDTDNKTCIEKNKKVWKKQNTSCIIFIKFLHSFLFLLDHLHQEIWREWRSVKMLLTIEYCPLTRICFFTWTQSSAFIGSGSLWLSFTFLHKFLFTEKMIFYFKKFGNNIKIVWWFLFLGFWQHKKRHVLSIEYLMRAVVWSDLKPRNQVSMMMLTFDHQNKLLEKQNRMRENSISGVRVTRIRRKYCMFADKKVERERKREYVLFDHHACHKGIHDVCCWCPSVWLTWHVEDADLSFPSSLDLLF